MTARWPSIRTTTRRGPPKYHRTRRADSRDHDVGQRVRARRLACGLTQARLAKRIGVTFQQVQHYENGVNRIGAGRLQRIATALDVPIAFFFENSTSAAQEARSHADSVLASERSSGAIRIVKALNRIERREVRNLIVALAEALAEASPS